MKILQISFLLSSAAVLAVISTASAADLPSGKAAPAMSSDQRINDLEEQIRKLQAEAQDARASKLAETGVQVRQTVYQAKSAVKTAVAAE